MKTSLSLTKSNRESSFFSITSIFVLWHSVIKCTEGNRISFLFFPSPFVLNQKDERWIRRLSAFSESRTTRNQWKCRFLGSIPQDSDLLSGMRHVHILVSASHINIQFPLSFFFETTWVPRDGVRDCRTQGLLSSSHSSLPILAT